MESDKGTGAELWKLPSPHSHQSEDHNSREKSIAQDGGAEKATISSELGSWSQVRDNFKKEPASYRFF